MDDALEEQHTEMEVDGNISYTEGPKNEVHLKRVLLNSETPEEESHLPDHISKPNGIEAERNISSDPIMEDRPGRMTSEETPGSPGEDHDPQDSENQSHANTEDRFIVENNASSSMEEDNLARQNSHHEHTNIDPVLKESAISNSEDLGQDLHSEITSGEAPPQDEDSQKGTIVFEHSNDRMQGGDPVESSSYTYEDRSKIPDSTSSLAGYESSNASSLLPSEIHNGENGETSNLVDSEVPHVDSTSKAERGAEQEINALKSEENQEDQNGESDIPRQPLGEGLPLSSSAPSQFYIGSAMVYDDDLDPSLRIPSRQVHELEDEGESCNVCGDWRHANSMLLCDQCDRGFHMQCLIPPLLEVPETEWFCPDCLKKKQPPPPKKIRPKKPKPEPLPALPLVPVEEFDDGQPCEHCKSWQDWKSMLLCDMCDKGYHMKCLDPPLSIVPPGDWFCPKCEEGDQEETKKKKSVAEEDDDWSIAEEEELLSDEESSEEEIEIGSEDAGEEFDDSDEFGDSDFDDDDSAGPRKNIKQKKSGRSPASDAKTKKRKKPEKKPKDGAKVKRLKGAKATKGKGTNGAKATKAGTKGASPAKGAMKTPKGAVKGTSKTPQGAIPKAAAKAGKATVAKGSAGASSSQLLVKPPKSTAKAAQAPKGPIKQPPIRGGKGAAMLGFIPDHAPTRTNVVPSSMLMHQQQQQPPQHHHQTSHTQHHHQQQQQHHQPHSHHQQQSHHHQQQTHHHQQQAHHQQQSHHQQPHHQQPHHQQSHHQQPHHPQPHHPQPHHQQPHHQQPHQIQQPHHQHQQSHHQQSQHRNSNMLKLAFDDDPLQQMGNMVPGYIQQPQHPYMYSNIYDQMNPEQFNAMMGNYIQYDNHQGYGQYPNQYHQQQQQQQQQQRNDFDLFDRHL